MIKKVAMQQSAFDANCNADDFMKTPQNTSEKKMSFWINQKYIQEKLLNSIYQK